MVGMEHYAQPRWIKKFRALSKSIAIELSDELRDYGKVMACERSVRFVSLSEYASAIFFYQMKISLRSDEKHMGWV